MVLAEFFTLQDGVYVQKRVQAEIERAHHRIETARANGKTGGRPKKNPAGFGSLIPIRTQQKPSGFSVGSETETGLKALQTPDSNLQSPEEESSLRSPDAQADEKPEETQRVSVRRGTKPTKRCPPDFVVPEDALAAMRAECPGVDIDRETRKFRDHTYAVARSDWLATWRNWIRGAVDRSPAGARQSAERQRAAETEARHWEGWKHRASKSGCRNPLDGESLPAYIAEVERHEQSRRSSGPKPASAVLPQLARPQ